MDAKALRVRAHKMWRKEIRPLVITVLIMFAVRSSLADWNDVPTGSMKPTILEGDRVFVNKLAYDLKVPFTTLHIAEWSAPHRGDIVVFYSPKDGTRLVKRTIGLPDDVVELRNNRLLINGEQVNTNLSLKNCCVIQRQSIEPIPPTRPNNFLAARIWWRASRLCRPGATSDRIACRKVLTS
jgi:signal peptidase I